MLFDKTIADLKQEILPFKFKTHHVSLLFMFGTPIQMPYRHMRH